MNNREGRIWTAIRGKLGSMLPDMKRVLACGMYEMESAHLDGMSAALAKAVEKELNDAQVSMDRGESHD